MSDQEAVSGDAQVQVANASAKLAASMDKKYGSILRISRYDYKIQWCDFILRGRQPCYGLCDPATKTIYIDVNNPKTVEETLVHEIMHAELAEGGFTGVDGFDDALEELLIQQISKAITHHFKLKRRA